MRSFCIVSPPMCPDSGYSHSRRNNPFRRLENPKRRSATRSSGAASASQAAVLLPHKVAMTETLAQLRAALSNRYAIEREIGHGGMATVYLARDLRHNRNVALKVLRPELRTAIGTERFLREIRTTAQLTHPHILAMHDSGEAAGLLYYIMPYSDGESLRDRLDRERRLSVDATLDITLQIADALAYAHAHGVIHRDIKPENILFSGGRHAWVSDFGVARA